MSIAEPLQPQSFIPRVGKRFVTLARKSGFADYEALTGALSNLAARKLRTALTMLGMVFGVGAVIAMLSIGAGGEKKALESIGKLGLHNVIVKASAIKPEDRADLRKKSLGVSLRDAEAIQESVKGVDAVLPRLEVKATKIFAAGGKAEAKVAGVSWRHGEFARVDLASGRFLDEEDELDHAQVAVIGDQVRRDLFGFRPALGEKIKVNDVWLEVIGTLAPDPAAVTTFGSVPTSSSGRQVLIPVSTAMRKFERDPLDAPLDELMIRVKDGVSTGAVAELVTPLLDRLHGGAEDFELVVPEALLEQSRQTQRIFNIVMGSIAGISLLVGGIGIMNIMLASVLERTREIGLRRAIGATKRDIRQQFVIESFCISFIGGVTGIVVGVLLAKIVAAYAGWPTVITTGSLLVSTGVSVIVGLVSGIYPAARAAELDPIEALRYE